MKYLNALEKRGYTVTLSASGGLIIPKAMPASLRAQVIQAKPTIIAELLSLESPAPTVRESPTVADPRPDLSADSCLWVKLLTLAGESDIGGTLHGFRCAGTQLRRTVTGWSLIRGADSIWGSDEEFVADLQAHIGTDLLTRKHSPLNNLLRQL